MIEKNYKKVQVVLLVILIANFAVAFLKIAVGTLINSASMTADGFHSLSDGSSNIVGLIGIHFASKPQDQDHPYGHHKFETLSALFISGMLFLVGMKVIIEAVDKFRHPVTPEITTVSLVALLLTLVVNIFVTVIEFRRGKALNSQILISDSMHTRSDIYVTVGVLATLIGVKLGLPPIIDSAASLVVAGFILHAAYEIFKENSEVLVDRAVIDTAEIEEIVMGFEEVRNVHKIRSRGTRSNLYIDLHIMVDPDLSVTVSHRLVHEIEEAVKKRIDGNSQVIAHLEPFEEGREDQDSTED